MHLVNCDPTAVGPEIKKTHSALIIQNNIGNGYSPIMIVAALATRSVRAAGQLCPVDAYR